jgi:UDP-GlcNAc:undecaprenyl-phosphate/decaprenyl-phosphate GlcNAc-1-phosphate transferase
MITFSHLYVIAILTGLLSIFATHKVVFLAKKYSIVDDPKSNINRKKQRYPIPLLGGSGFVIVSTLVSLLLVFFRNSSFLNLGDLVSISTDKPSIFWISISIIILLIGGFLDDKYQLKPKWMVIPIISALIIAIFPGNLVVTTLSYPLNSILPQNIVFLPQLLSFLWLGSCLAATKFLDGHDGLVTTVGIISLLSIASVSLFASVAQPLTFGLCLVWIAGLCGYLPSNFPDARSYLGEGASEVIGFVIGVLAIISGAKIASAATVIGWFILDIIIVMFIRILKKESPFSGDRLHWHFRLLDFGFNKIQVLVITTILIIITSHFGLSFTTDKKFIVFVFQLAFIGLLFIISSILLWFKNKSK